MWIYVTRRILYAIPIALGVSVVCFSLVYLAPGDPLQALLPPDAAPEDIEAIRHLYGLDKPVPLQYLDWLLRVAGGDLGISLQTNRPVFDEVMRALSNTLVITIGAVTIAFTLAFLLGALAAYNRGTWIDRLVTVISAMGVSVPNYWLAILLVIFFSVKMRLLPATGMGGQGSDHFSWLDWQQVRYAVLPILTTAMLPLGVIMRSSRSAIAEVLNQDFIRLLRAKGLRPVTILGHAVKNAVPQVLAVMGLQFGHLIGGSILIETIFTWPGTGFLMSKAILARDVPLLQGTILVLALAFVLINLVVDVMQTIIDPRIKRA